MTEQPCDLAPDNASASKATDAWPAESLIGRMNAHARSHQPFDLSQANYEVVLRATCEQPLVSVITRTQGKREWGIADVLDSLRDQTCADFELVLVAHNAEDAAFARLVETVEAAKLVDALAGRITLVRLTGGRRAHPLNVGAALSRGTYFSILDDDDLIMPDFVRLIKENAPQHPARMLYSYVLVQTWSLSQADANAEPDATPDPNENPKAAPAANLSVTQPIGDLQLAYCRPFDPVAQFSENRCPLIGFAFPRYVFARVGVSFDEALDVLEDWDFIMRASKICGVATIPEPTSLYRFWDNEENSHTLHDAGVWRETKKAIQNKLDAAPTLLPEGCAWPLAEAGAIMRAGSNDGLMREALEWTDLRLFFDCCDEFTAQRSMHPSPAADLAEGVYTFVFPDMEPFGKQANLRLDPDEHGGIAVRDCVLVVEFADGGSQMFTNPQFITNGIKLDDGSIIFLKNDPQIIIELACPRVVKSVTATFKADLLLTDAQVDAAIARESQRAVAEHTRAELDTLERALMHTNKANRVAWRAANRIIGWQPGSTQNAFEARELDQTEI